MGLRKIRKILGTILYFLGIFVAAWLIVHFVAQRTVVDGPSMETTLYDGDNLIIDKISYRFEDPKRFDIIVFPFQYKENTFYIKRIIGLPGETVSITENGIIMINGEPLQESYGKEVIRDPGMAKDPITLSDGEYFVLGDNRNNSSDSRDPSVGIIKRSDIVGRAFMRLYPFDRIGFLNKNA